MSTAQIMLKETVPPPTPPLGYITIYSKADGYLYQKDDQGVETAFVGNGDVHGPASAVSANIAVFDGVTGKYILDSGLSAASFLAAGTTTAGVPDSTNKRYVTDAQLALQHGVNDPNSSITHVGTTSIALNRASGAQSLTGITSIDGNAATVTGLAVTAGQTLTVPSGGTLGTAAYTAATAYDAAGAAATVQSNLGTHTGLTGTSVHGLGSASTHASTDFATSTQGGKADTALQPAAIGVTVQAYDADLTTWAGITPGTGIGTALAANVGSAGAPVVNGGALGTPSSGNLASCTFPTLNQNTTGTAGGLTGTPNISVGTVASGTTTITGDLIVDQGTSNYGGLRMASGRADAAARNWGISQNYAAMGDMAIRISNAQNGHPFTAGTTVIYATTTGLNNTAIGATTPSTGAFTTVSAMGIVKAVAGNANTTANIGTYGTFVSFDNNTEQGWIQAIAGAAAYRTLQLNPLGGIVSVSALLDLSASTAGQIKFPATQNASSDANTLDDYDEYTAASAACTGAITTAVVWKLTKIGNKVTLTLPSTLGTASTATNFVFGTVIPSKYRPATDTLQVIPIKDAGVNQAAPGAIYITAAGGAISIYAALNFTANYTIGDTSGLAASVTASWTI